MKKGQEYTGKVVRMDFPNKGIVEVQTEEGTETAAVNTGPARGPRPASSMPITVVPAGKARSKSRETAFISSTRGGASSAGK